MPASNTSVNGYLTSLPADQRKVVSVVRETIRKNLPPGYKEMMQGKFISYVIPLSRLPDTYNGHALMYAALAVQKNYYSVHLLAAYGSPKELGKIQEGFKKAGKKLDMGKACIRFKKLDDLPLDVIGESVARVPAEEYIRRYESVKRK